MQTYEHITSLKFFFFNVKCNLRKTEKTKISFPKCKCS